LNSAIDIDGERPFEELLVIRASRWFAQSTNGCGGRTSIPCFEELLLAATIEGVQLPSAPIRLAEATLGHASVSTTGRYLHARPSESSARFLGV